MSYKNIIDDTKLALQHLATVGMLRRAGSDIVSVTVAGTSGILVAGVQEEVWPSGGIRTVMETPDTFTVVSDSADDDATGSGSKAIVIAGLDSNWNAQVESLPLEGLTPVVSTLEFRRIHRATVVSTGTNHTNVGNITITETTGGTPQCYIVAGKGVSSCAHYTIPAGYNGLLVKAIYNLDDSNAASPMTATVENMIRVHSSETDYIELMGGAHTLNDAATSLSVEDFELSLIIPEKTDFTVKTITNRNGVVINAIVSLLLLRGDFTSISIEGL